MAETEPTPSGQSADAIFWANRKSAKKRRSRDIQSPPRKVQSFYSELCGDK